VVNSRRLVERGSRARLRIAGDARLTARIREGDRRAFEAVYDRYAAEMLRFGVYLLGNRHDAEDAVQAAFTAAWRSLCADRRPVALRPWLFTITRNECVTMLRSRKQTVELNGELAITDDPVEHLIIGEDLRLLLASIAKLPEQQRAALVLAEAHGLAHPGDRLGAGCPYGPDQGFRLSGASEPDS
jgi:RNA polymerase sigma factor (sigma-70 family)